MRFDLLGYIAVLRALPGPRGLDVWADFMLMDLLLSRPDSPQVARPLRPCVRLRQRARRLRAQPAELAQLWVI